MDVFRAGLAGPSLQRSKERRGFAADERAAAPVDLHIEGKVAAQNVLAQEPRLAGLLHRARDVAHRQRVFVADIDVALAGADRVGADDHPFEDQVGISLQEAAVHVGAGIALVRVADDILGLALGLAGLIPLPARRESAAAPAPEVGLDHLLDDLLGLHRQGLPQRAVAVDGQVVFEFLRIDLEVQAEDQAGLLLVEGNFLLVDDFLARGGVHIEEPVDHLPLQQGLVDNLGRVAQPDALVEDVFRADDDHRAPFAEAVTSAGPKVDFVG